MLYLPHSGVDRFYFDSDYYWYLGGTFRSYAGLSLLAYHDPLRGYSLPLALGGLRWLVRVTPLDAMTAVRLAYALLVTLLGVELLPRLARRVIPWARITLPRIMLLNGLLFLFWRDYLNFPLSDFPALAAAGGALLLVVRPRWYAHVGAGFLGGLALNIRPVYLYAMVLLVPLAAVRAARAKDERPAACSAALAAALVVAGLAAALAPQVAINRHNFGRTSPFPINNRELSLLQLTTGMYIQKYESAVSAEAPTGQVLFDDPTTKAILAHSGRRGIGSFTQYVNLVIHHPRAFVGAYFRRLFNGFDAEYPTPYVRHVFGDRSAGRSFLLYSLLFVATAMALLGIGSRSPSRVDWALLLLFLLPAVIALAGSVETRYFLPAHVAAYALVAFGLGARGWRFFNRRRCLALAVAYATFVAGCFALADDTYGFIRFPKTPVVYEPRG